MRTASEEVTYDGATAPGSALEARVIQVIFRIDPQRELRIQPEHRTRVHDASEKGRAVGLQVGVAAVCSATLANAADSAAHVQGCRGRRGSQTHNGPGGHRCEVRGSGERVIGAWLYALRPTHMTWRIIHCPLDAHPTEDP